MVIRMKALLFFNGHKINKKKNAIIHIIQYIIITATIMAIIMMIFILIEYWNGKNNNRLKEL